jgi:hypothetical protein
MRRNILIIVFIISSSIMLPLFVGEFRKEEYGHCLILFVLFVLALKGFVKIFQNYKN